MKTVFVYANSLGLSALRSHADILNLFENTALPAIAEHVVVFPVEFDDLDLSEYHAQVAAHAIEFGEADVFFYAVDASQLRIVLELTELSSEIIFH